ncbi:hypothetical protein OG780_35840 [Streptomyces sp. NBC_00386]|uniref:hypothetical protein n=1 Tax=Streptomyces sp. NBC_00386 TaxID=2975734 RepID=UPI002E1BA462
MTAGWCTRMLRAVMFAAVCVVLAGLGHVMMSGSPVAWWALAGAGTVTAGAGWCLAGRERGLPFVVSVVVLAQGVLHSAFSMAQSLAFAADAGTGPSAGPGQSGRGAMGVMDGMSMDAMGSMDMSSMDVMGIGSMGMGSMGSLTMDSGTMGSGAMAHLFPWGADAGSPSSFGMFAAHLLAALLCGLWLAHGERAAFRVLRALAGRLAAPLWLLLALPVPPYRPTLRVRRRSSDRAPRLLLLVHAITSRGPPVGTAVA